MTLAAQSAPAAPAIDALAPLRLPADLRLTPEQFEQVCAENPEAVLELGADGQLITMAPTGSETGARNSELIFQLQQFARSTGLWKVFDSSAGFRLPDGSVFSPDASMLRLERWQALSPAERRGFAPLCPDLVVEAGKLPRRRPARRHGPAPQDGGLPSQRRPLGLVAAA